MKTKINSTVLLVDDNPHNIFSMQNLLERSDRNFLTATCGKEALKLALSQSPDLIVLDVNMPDMNGFEVAEILKSNKRTCDIPILFASAEKKEAGNIKKGFAEGGVDYLFKPLDPETTRAKVEAILKMEISRRELEKNNLLLQRYELLINNSADIICIIDPVLLKIEEVNNAVFHILGYKPEELKGTKLQLLVCNEDREKITNLAKLSKEKFSLECRVYAKDRTIKWLHWNIVVQQAKWFANARDVTQARQVEVIRHYLATVVKQSGDAIYLHDQDGAIISWNKGAENIYGFTETEALSMKIWNIIPNHLYSETQEIINRICNGEKISMFESHRITKHGKIIDVLFSASVLKDENQKIRSIAITERDITQQKINDEKIKSLNLELSRNLAKLEVINRELESFSYSVSHDLRAPLRIINGFIKIIKEDHETGLNDDVKKNLNIIILNVLEMEQLISGLLAFSKISRKELVKTKVQMDWMVKEIVAQESSSKPTLSVKVNIHQLPDAIGDALMLKQVWTNLISNAFKYSSKKKNPEITIGFTQLENDIMFFIKDNGVGFDMTNYDRLFGVFQRLHTDSDFEGTGVGLALVQRIINKHGGKVWAEGKTGEGAVFYFTLPVVKDE
ncbi:MAG: hypothetical protein A3H98_06075 [Bacteroidetes bacterium RIFCSPLOWO2_02_FULL_36_8]|nr:MAG: hypothetical protein A3H98_06075 [Bacteroidetes bacterium RIFCSPLOWO2_02_FULL_36_8]OFY72071.1 MAG: hypothetical protein A3G23_06810 [Bacteroidetes bacterium RIFCSPLOWO2_12_FULL_37_12]